MPYTVPENIENITLYLEEYDSPEDNENITLFLGTEVPPDENPDYVLQEAKRVESDTYVDLIPRRVQGESYIELRGYRCINPDNEAPSVNNNELLIQVGETSFIVSFEKATDNATPDNQLFYQLYYSSENQLNTLDDIDRFGSLVNSGTDVDQLALSGVPLNSQVFVNIVVRDLAGNRIAYGGDTTVLQEEEITSFEILDANFFMQSGNSRQIIFEVNGIGEVDTSVTWESSDTDILTVNSEGVVTGVSEGVVTLTMISNEDPNLTDSILIGVDTYEFQSPSEAISFTTETEE
jgi:hypothetical protein